ncbi:MAG: hypothetical protein OEZ18_03805 [Candidatus Bathyarchaeota archaeon]|nr:hypothetical protein [Candidatus Bathyarchaeota archaeon]
MHKNQFGQPAFRLVIVRSLVLCFLILSVFLPYVKITYYGEHTFENVFWYSSLWHQLETDAGSLYHSAQWNVEWFAMPIFAFPFALMYFGLKKRYTFDLGVIVYALFLGWMTLPPLISPMSMGAGWILIESEALIGSYIAPIVLVVYGVARLFLQGVTGGLEADRIPPPESVEQPDVVKRRFILVLALLSFVLPFAVEYKIFHDPEYEPVLYTVHYWFGKMVEFDTASGGLRFPIPLPVSLLFLPVMYLPLIMMWLGMNRTRMFTNGVRLFTIYWAWHLLFFLQPFYVTWPLHEDIIAPTVGIVFFPTILLIYILSFFFKSARINRFLLELGSKGAKGTPKTFLKECPKCGREIPIASEECQYCETKQP